MRKPSPAMIVALLSLFVALGGAGMAATGGNFILGKANSATSTTSLSTPIGGKALQVTNGSTTSGASALGLNVASGHAPLTVNSATKVTNLNADKLDGIDSSGFLPKTGKAADADKLDGIDSSGFLQGRGTALANRIVVADQATDLLLSIPGLGHLQATCNSAAGGAFVDWINDTGGNVDVWWDTAQSHFSYEIAPDDTDLLINDQHLNENGATLALGIGTDPNALRTAVLHVFSFETGLSTTPCDFQVQGTLWTSP